MVPAVVEAELIRWLRILRDLESGPRADERRSNMSLVRLPAARNWGHRNPARDS